MNADRRFSDLLGIIYDASLDAARWQDVVEGIAGFIPGSFVNLFSQDATRKSAQAFFTHGIEQEYLDLYFQKYMHINPMFPAMKISCRNPNSSKPASTRSGFGRRGWWNPWPRFWRNPRSASLELLSG